MVNQVPNINEIKITDIYSHAKKGEFLATDGTWKKDEGIIKHVTRFIKNLFCVESYVDAYTRKSLKSLNITNDIPDDIYNAWEKKEEENRTTLQPNAYPKQLKDITDIFNTKFKDRHQPKIQNENSITNNKKIDEELEGKENINKDDEEFNNIENFIEEGEFENLNFVDPIEYEQLQKENVKKKEAKIEFIEEEIEEEIENNPSQPFFDIDDNLDPEKERKQP